MLIKNEIEKWEEIKLDKQLLMYNACNVLCVSLSDTTSLSMWLRPHSGSHHYSKSLSHHDVLV